MATLWAATNKGMQRHTVCGIPINTSLARTGGVGLEGKSNWYCQQNGNAINQQASKHYKESITKLIPCKLVVPPLAIGRMITILLTRPAFFKLFLFGWVALCHSFLKEAHSKSSQMIIQISWSSGLAFLVPVFHKNYWSYFIFAANLFSFKSLNETPVQTCFASKHQSVYMCLVP